MNPDDLREILGCGDLVRYDTPSFRFEGIVTAIDEEADLVSVETTDYWGEKREYDCGFERIELLLKAAALTISAETISAA